jgi:hypothetical protein
MMGLALWEWRKCRKTFTVGVVEYQEGKKYCIYEVPPELQDQSDWKVMIYIGGAGGGQVSADLFDPL